MTEASGVFSGQQGRKSTRSIFAEYGSIAEWLRAQALQAFSTLSLTTDDLGQVTYLFNVSSYFVKQDETHKCVVNIKHNNKGTESRTMPGTQSSLNKC